MAKRAEPTPEPRRRFGLKRRKSAATDVDAPPGRIAAIRQAYTFTAKTDKKLPLILLGAFLGPFVLLLVVGLILHHAIVLGVLGFAIGFLLATTLFTRRSQKAQYDSVEGQPGVAAAIAERMRSNPLRMTPAVQINREQSMVHRGLGRSGVVLLAEGRSSGPLIANERRRLAKVLGDTPITVISIGNGEGEVPLGKLQAKLMKLPRTLQASQVDAIELRLRALPGTGSGGGMPMPKGPMPTRMPRGKVR